jgi:hypothetical protein
MPATAGAYSRSTGTIYLNADWLQQASEEQAIAVLTQELGHHLDALLNSEETPGDEGEHFALLLLQVALTPERLEALRAEDDHTTIRVDGDWVAVEQATFNLNGIFPNDSVTGTAGADTFNVNAGVNIVKGLGIGADVLVVAAVGSANVTLGATWTATAASKNDGAVDLFANGHSVSVAAATSTGGMVAKRAGRVGDSPILGAGTYADDETGAASATGEGEAVLRLALTRHVCELLGRGSSAQEAAEAAIARLGARLGASGGIIVVDAHGRVGHARNTQTMSWGHAREGEEPRCGH